MKPTVYFLIPKTSSLNDFPFLKEKWDIIHAISLSPQTKFGTDQINQLSLPEEIKRRNVEHDRRFPPLWKFEITLNKIRLEII